MYRAVYKIYEVTYILSNNYNPVALADEKLHGYLELT